MAAVDANPSFLSVSVTSSLSDFGSQKRFPAAVTIGELKGKLELITGATASLMQLQLFDADGKLICELDSDDAPLGSYPVQDGFRLHVIDKDPSKKAGQFEDLSEVKKYEISDGDYAKRTDSVLAFKQRMKLGRFADKGKNSQGGEQEEERERQEKAEADDIPVGSRCEVTLQKSTPRRGTVMFVGKVHFKPGYWVGVRYDEPLGKNDGSVDGKRYFECPPKYGAFVKPKSVRVGDFPEETFSDEDEM